MSVSLSLTHRDKGKEKCPAGLGRGNML